MKKTELPKVSFILLTLNGGEGVRKVLESIREQKYPKRLVEVIVVDDGSSDDSVKIAKKYGAKVFINPQAGLYANWIVALHELSGKFVYYVEQDIELRGNNFIQKMIAPMLFDKRIVASFTREGYPRADQSWTTRFLSYHPSQCDPLYEFLTPSVQESFLMHEKGYILCKFVLGKLPPFGRMFYRVEYLKKTPNWRVKYYFDHDFLIQMVKSGYDLFAYLPQVGIYHSHAKSLKHLLLKRARNLDIHYFPYNKQTEYKWLNTKNQWSVFRLFLWIIYANLFLPELIRGLVRAIKHKDLVLLMEPIVAISVTDVVLYKFLTNKEGKNMIFEAIRTLLHGSKNSRPKAFG